MSDEKKQDEKQSENSLAADAQELSNQAAAENADPEPHDGAASGASAAAAGLKEDENLDELRAQAAQAKEHWDRLLRVTADLENFRKRAARERTEAIRYANEALLEKLLPILDSFEMALAAAAKAPESSADGRAESLRTGIEMVCSQLKGVMAEAGLEEIDASGKEFDPRLHEAVSQQETTEVAEGHVVQQLRRGYKLKDRLLRPASVIVAKKP